jgi:hypothetical protein
MRNISLASITRTSIDDAKISATAIDLDSSVIYIASEKTAQDELEIGVWKIANGEVDEANGDTLVSSLVSSPYDYESYGREWSL